MVTEFRALSIYIFLFPSKKQAGYTPAVEIQGTRCISRRPAWWRFGYTGIWTETIWRGDSACWWYIRRKRVHRSRKQPR